MSHWLLLLTLGFGQDQWKIPTGSFDPITGYEHYQIYRSHTGCERAAKPWRTELVAIDPMYQIRCVRYGQRKLDI
jgi:hypothetical protein